MAVPRIFVSSTFYDLRQVRNNIGDFIRNLGYDAVMHEHSGIAYTQNVTLETDCYNEITTCDIVICIIGNHFGTQAEKNNLSITMNELETAIKNKKKIYIFIAKDVFIENKTYEQNKEHGKFKSAYTDNNQVHEFISSLKQKIRNNVIEAFETTDEIIATLKLQFAGLFQNLLLRESSLTEEKTAYDLQESVEHMRGLIKVFSEEHEDFLSKFDSTYFRRNPLLIKIGDYIGLKNVLFFVRNLSQLDELMQLLDYEIVDDNDELLDCRKYVYIDDYRIKTLILKNELLDRGNWLRKLFTPDEINNYLIWSEEENEDCEPAFSSNMDEVPF